MFEGTPAKLGGICSVKHGKECEKLLQALGLDRPAFEVCPTNRQVNLPGHPKN
jgi:hypothetical protein